MTENNLKINNKKTNKNGNIFLNPNKAREYLKKYSFLKEEDTVKFWKDKRLKNIITGEVFVMNPETLTFEYQQRQKFQKKLFKTQQLQELGQGKIALFLTITLAPSYHRTSKGKINFNFNEELIKKGYEALQKATQKINKRMCDRFKKTSYIRVAEPHDDLTPHFHILYWIEEENYDELEKIITKEIKRNIKNNEGLGYRFDIKKVIEEENSNVTAYIMKYLFKDLKSNNDSRYHDGYAKYFGFKNIFTSSQVPISTKYYNILKAGTKETKEDLRDLGYLNFGSFCLKNVQIEQKTKKVENSFLKSGRKISKKKETPNIIKNEVKNPKYLIENVIQKIINEENIKIIDDFILFDSNKEKIIKNRLFKIEILE